MTLLQEYILMSLGLTSLSITDLSIGSPVRTTREELHKVLQAMEHQKLVTRTKVGTVTVWSKK